MAARVRRCHRYGWSDVRIAAKLGCSTTQVWRVRKSLGLPQVGGRGDRKGAYRRQMSTLSLRKLADARVDRSRVGAATMGWPVGVSTESARWLEALYKHGCMTVRQLAGMIGTGARRAIRHLVAEGLLVRVGQPRSLRTPRSRRRDARRPAALCRPYLYDLAEETRALRDRVAARRGVTA